MITFCHVVFPTNSSMVTMIISWVFFYPSRGHYGSIVNEFVTTVLDRDDIRATFFYGNLTISILKNLRE